MKFYVKTKLSENISVTPEGFLLCRNVPLTHTGELVYTQGEHPFEDIKGDAIVTRAKEDLFSDATVSSFEGKPITIKHPTEFVSPDNWSEVSNGVLMNVRPSQEQVEVDEEMVWVLLGDFLITTTKAIEAVNNGLREVSLGYDALWTQTGKNTVSHTKIIGNHCALVDNGRAGINCAIQDSKGEEEMSKSLKEKFKKFYGKTVDEAVKEKEDAEAKDAEAVKAAKDAEEAEAKKVKDAEEAEAKKKEDEEKAAKEKADKEKKEKDGESKDAGDIEERMSKVESMIAEIVKLLSGDSEEVVAEEDDEDEEDGNMEGSEEELESEDEEEMESEDEESEEEDKSKKEKANDTMARAEILAPGIKESKDVKRKALEIAFKTTDGKKLLAPLLGGKSIKDTKDIEGIFFAASQLMKHERTGNVSRVKAVALDNFPTLKQKGAMTAEDINTLNKTAFNRK